MTLERRSRGLRPRPAYPGDVDRHLRRQYAGGFLPLRRERVSVRRPGEPLGHAPRDQEPQLLPLPAAGHRLRGPLADRAARGRPRHPAGHRAVRPGLRRDAHDAQQGRRARLPLLPRPRPAAACSSRPARIEAGQGRHAGAAGGDAGALCSRRYGLSAYDAAQLTVEPGDGALFRGGGGGSRRRAGQACCQLGDGRGRGAPQP